MTNLLVILSLVLITAVVLVLVGYLLGIIFTLWSAGTYLKQLAGGLEAVRTNTAPLPEDIPVINGALKKLLTGLLHVNGNLAAIVDVASKKQS